jgi:GNAT superfamily N-acetyltransferase
MMSIDFRICTELDLVMVREHAISLYQEDPPGMKMNAEKFDRTFQEFTNKPEKGRVIVFAREHLIVGYAIIVFFWSNEYGGDLIEVDELFVHQDYRGRGVATTFFGWLEKTWERKVVALALQVTPANDRAFNFYQRLGFESSCNHHLIKKARNA